MKNISKIFTLFALSIAVVFMFNACGNKKELFEICYYDEIHSYDNRSVNQRQKDDGQCFKLTNLEKKDESSEEAIKHYARACELNTPDNACEHLASLVTNFTKINIFVKKCQENTDDTPCMRVKRVVVNEYDPEGIFKELCQQGNKNACFEFKKAVLSSEQFEKWDLSEWKIRNDFDKMCKENLPKACIERDKMIEKSVAKDLQMGREENSSYSFYIRELDKFCRWDGLNAEIAKRACAGRDELINAHEKGCNENNATSCKVLTLAYAEFLSSGASFDFDKDSYESEADKIYPAKFKAVANKACDLGEVTGCEYLAFFYYGYEPELNYTLARQFGKRVVSMLQNAHKQGVYLSSVDIPLDSFIYAEEETNDDESVKKESILYYFRAACDDLKSAEHCFSFGHFYNKGKEGFDFSQKQALHYYDKACALGGEDYCMHLGKIYLFGKAVGGKKVKKDLAKARRYFAKECKNIGGFCSDACSDTDDTSCYLARMKLNKLKKIDEQFFDKCDRWKRGRMENKEFCEDLLW